LRQWQWFAFPLSTNLKKEDSIYLTEIAFQEVGKEDIFVFREECFIFNQFQQEVVDGL
jgi:hypothetical protein